MYLLMLLACGAPLQDDDRHDIQAAAVRWLMAETNAAGGAACLRVADIEGGGDVIGAACADPEADRAALVADLSGEALTAVPSSECTFELESEEDPFSQRWRLEENGEAAALFEVGCPGEPEAGVVTIAVVHEIASLAAEQYTCTLRRSAGGWVVEGCELGWMS